jgi:hypothetical protein
MAAVCREKPATLASNEWFGIQKRRWRRILSHERRRRERDEKENQ